MGKAPYIEEGRLQHLLKVAAGTQANIRNVILIATVHGVGTMRAEIAKLSVCAYLNGDSLVRVKSCVDACIPYSGKERPVYWSNAEGNFLDSVDKFRSQAED